MGVVVDRGGASLGTAAKARDRTVRGSNIITQTKLRLNQTKQNINKLEYCKWSRYSIVLVSTAIYSLHRDIVLYWMRQHTYIHTYMQININI